MSRTTTIVVCGFGLLLMVCLMPAGIGPFGIPVEFVFNIALGWIVFLVRSIPRMQVNWADVFLGAAALLLFAGGVHWLGRSWVAGGKERRAVASVDELASQQRMQWRWRYSLSIVALVVLMFTAGTAMIGLVHQTAWLATMDGPVFDGGGVRQAARRNGSVGQLRQLSVGALNYEAATEALPAGCTTDDSGRLLHGWMTQLLPYLDLKSRYDSIDHSQPWNSPANTAYFQEPVFPFLNPGLDMNRHDERGFAVAHYSANAYVMGGDRPRTLKDIPDGIAQSILLGESNGNHKAWGSPTNWRDPALGLRQSPDGFGGPWSGGVTLFSYADGHVQTISADIDPEVFRALCTPAGGEKVNLDEL